MKFQLPSEDGFAMPAEWAPQSRVWMIWPTRPDNWRENAAPAQKAFAAVAQAISRFAPVTMLAPAPQLAAAREMLGDAVDVTVANTDDAWARDTGPSFLLDASGALAGVDWRFNAWGGLYTPCAADDALAARILTLAGARRFWAPVVLEGGAIHVDGEGTVLTTESCLLDERRNPDLGRAEMERHLRDYLGIETVIWLQGGVPHDETGGHIDNLACFVRPGTVLLSWCDDPSDPHYAVSRDAEARLLDATDARGRRLTVERIPMPEPMAYTPAEAAGVAPGPSNMARRAGEPLAGSYVNFLIVNGGIIAPGFGTAMDAAARHVLERLFAPREIVMLPAREILLGGGNIHCITQQQPIGESRFGS